jgi:hypothetical protein
MIRGVMFSLNRVAWTSCFNGHSNSHQFFCKTALSLFA